VLSTPPLFSSSLPLDSCLFSFPCLSVLHIQSARKERRRTISEYVCNNSCKIWHPLFDKNTYWCFTINVLKQYIRSDEACGTPTLGQIVVLCISVPPISKRGVLVHLLTKKQRWSFPLILNDWESGSGSFSSLRTLGDSEWEWEWEWVWAIRKNFALKRNFFLESLASRRGSLHQKITIFLGVEVSRKWAFF